MLDFKAVCDKYTAVAKTLLGLQKAENEGMSEALMEWQNASDLGYAKAQFNMGLCYETGDGVKQDLKEVHSSSDLVVNYYTVITMRGHTPPPTLIACLFSKSCGR